MQAYKLLKTANLPTRDEQLVKATITELKYNAVKTKLVQIFSDNTEVPTIEITKMNIKPEPTNNTQSYADGNTYNENNYENKTISYQQDYVYNDNEIEAYHETLHTRNNRCKVRF